MKIYIIGTGVMGSAISKVLSSKGEKVFVYDKSFTKTRLLAKNRYITEDRNFTNLPKADFVILAVKPYHMPEVADDVRSKIKLSATLISIAAGVKISRIQKLFNQQKVVRIMPNLGISVGEGIAAWTSSGLKPREKAAVKKLINKFTENFEVKENQLDAVTAISGSGPAYFFYFAEGLEKAAKDFGFKPIQARKLVEKTFSAAAALQKGKDYNQLIKQVASKKGTTEQAIKSFQQSKLREIVKKAVKAAYKRAKEISND